MDCSPTCPLSLGFPRQKYGSGLPFLSSGDPLNPGIKSESPAFAGGFYTIESPEKLYKSSISQDKKKSRGRGLEGLRAFSAGSGRGFFTEHPLSDGHIAKVSTLLSQLLLYLDSMR